MRTDRLFRSFNCCMEFIGSDVFVLFLQGSKPIWFHLISVRFHRSKPFLFSVAIPPRFHGGWNHSSGSIRFHEMRHLSSKALSFRVTTLLLSIATNIYLSTSSPVWSTTIRSGSWGRNRSIVHYVASGRFKHKNQSKQESQVCLKAPESVHSLRFRWLT